MGKSEVHVFTRELKTTYQVGEIVPIRRKQPENLHRKLEKRKNKEIIIHEKTSSATYRCLWPLRL